MRAHLERVNESYFQHMRHGLGFALELILGAICCLIHAFLPFLFETTGSNIIKSLHDKMVVNRANLGANAQRGEQRADTA